MAKGINRRVWMKLLTAAPLTELSAAPAKTMRLTSTPRGTYEMAWPGGRIELNFVPMSPAVQETSGQKVAFTKMRADASLYLPIADLVGVTAMHLQDAPPVPRILWDNREHHFWDGFDGAFEPRNVVVNEPRIEQQGDALVRASYYYIANHVKTTITWEFSPPAKANCRANWTTTIQVENRRTDVLRNYVQFFACYHKAATNYYWDASNRILPCTDGGFTATRDEDFSAMLRSSPYTVHMNRYRENHSIAFRTYRHPVLLSEKEPSFGGLRHITLSQPDTCGGIVTWNQQARDYQITPPDRTLRPGATFKARIRHLIAPAESVEDLESHWRDFQEYVLAVG